MMFPSLDPNQITGALLIGALFIFIGIALSWFVRRAVRELLRHAPERVDQIGMSFLSHFSILLIWLVLATLYAHVIPPLHKLGTALLTGVSLMSVIVGFAAQTTLGNLVAGISLILYKPFRHGDKLQIQTPAGLEIAEVEDITLGYTVLVIDGQRKIIVANSDMAQRTMIKFSSSQPESGQTIGSHKDA